MGFQVSPGVEVNEVDLTNVIPAVSTSIGAFAGHFSWGPVGEVGLVSSEKELVNEYGTPSSTADGGDYDNYTSFLQAASFLKYANTLRISRAISDDAKNASGSRHRTATDVVKIDNDDSFDDLSSFGSIAGVIQARCPGALGNSLKAHIACAIYSPNGTAGKFSDSNLDNSVNAVAGTTTWAASNVQAGANDEIHVIIVDEDGRFSGTKGAILEIFEGLSLYADATKEGGSNYYKTVINRDSDYVYINETAFATSFQSSISGVDYAVPGTLGSSGKVFSANLVADSSIATTTNVLTEYYSGEAPVDELAVGTYTVTHGVTPGILYEPDAGATGSGAKFEIDISINANTSTYEVAVTVLDGGFGYDVDDRIDVPYYELLGGTQDDDHFVQITIATVNDEDLFGYSLSGGTDGSDAADAASKADVVTALGYFDNPSEIDVNLVFAETDDDPSVSSIVADKVLSLCDTTRKDCVGFISPAPTANDVDAVSADLDFNSSYVILDSSAVYVYNKYTDSYRYIPANGHIAGLCARTDDTNDPWFSPAGYNRGNLLGVTKLKWNPNKSERDELYKSGINPVIAEPGQGILLFGDKTAQSKPSAFDRINVRRLFIVLEKAISTASKFQLFELNDEFTRAMFRNMTEPFLRDVKGRRGITDFMVVCDETNNTGDVIDTNRFVADIYIKPARSINFITLNFIATRTGVEFSEIVGTGN